MIFKSPAGQFFDRRDFRLCASCFFFLKDEELAQNVVQNNDDDVGRELHHHVVPAEQIDAQVHEEHIQKSRTDARTEKRGELPADLLCALCLAAKYPAAVRHIGEQHAQHPRGGRAEHRAATERMREQPVGDIVYRRREHAEDHVGDEILVFLIESFQLFVHFLTSKFDRARRLLRVMPEEDGGAVLLAAHLREPGERTLLKFAVEARERHNLRAEYIPTHRNG